MSLCFENVFINLFAPSAPHQKQSLRCDHIEEQCSFHAHGPTRADALICASSRLAMSWPPQALTGTRSATKTLGGWLGQRLLFWFDQLRTDCCCLCRAPPRLPWRQIQWEKYSGETWQMDGFTDEVMQFVIRQVPKVDGTRPPHDTIVLLSGYHAVRAVRIPQGPSCLRAHALTPWTMVTTLTEVAEPIIQRVIQVL